VRRGAMLLAPCAAAAPDCFSQVSDCTVIGFWRFVIG
jgi:hypothetical protein